MRLDIEELFRRLRRGPKDGICGDENGKKAKTHFERNERASGVDGDERSSARRQQAGKENEERGEINAASTTYHVITLLRSPRISYLLLRKSDRLFH